MNRPAELWTAEPGYTIIRISLENYAKLSQELRNRIEADTTKEEVVSDHVTGKKMRWLEVPMRYVDELNQFFGGP